MKKLLLLFIPLIIFGQDTIYNPFNLFSYKIPAGKLNKLPHLWNEIDTLQSSFIYELGQLGKPYLRFYYDIPVYRIFSSNFQEFFTRYENVYWWTPEQTLFFDTKKPMSYVCFNQSSRQTQILDAIYSQSVSEKFNITLRYKRRTAVGAYLRSTTDHYNLHSNFYYKFLKNKITVGAIWNFNQQVDELNGGADSISLININFFEKNAQPIALTATKLLRKGNYITLPISIKPINNLQLNYSFQYLWYDKRFSEGNTIAINNLYFPYSLYLGVIDTIKPISLFYYLNQQKHVGSLQIKISQFHSAIGSELLQQKFNSNFFDKNNNITALNYYVAYNDTFFTISSEGKYVKHSLFSEPEMYSKANLSLRLKKFLFNLSGEYHRRTPQPLVLTNTILTSYKISPSYTDVFITKTAFGYGNKVLLIPYYSVVNSQKYSGVILKTNTKMLKKFHIVAKIVYRFIKDEYLPLLNGKFSLYFQDSIFSSAVLRLGLENYFFTEFRSLYFNPITQLYYVPFFSIRSYPYLRSDFIIELNIKRFLGFIRIIHWNEGFVSPGYFIVSGYPMWERSFNFGIQWFVFD